MWALGCVLYELCTLKHAFSADNLLGLVYKIVQDKYDPIPSMYSKDLQNLIHSLLNKNAQERPSVAQVLQLPFIQTMMLAFVQSNGVSTRNPVYVKNAPVIVPELTAKERMLLKKEEETRRKIEEQKQAARNAQLNY